MDVCVCLCVYVHHMYVGVCGSQMKVLDSLKLELQEVVGHPMWVLGTKSRSSAREVSVHDSWTMSPAPTLRIILLCSSQ